MRVRKFVARCDESVIKSLLNGLRFELEKPNPNREETLFLFDEAQSALARSRAQMMRFFEEEYEENGPKEEDEG